MDDGVSRLTVVLNAVGYGAGLGGVEDPYLGVVAACFRSILVLEKQSKSRNLHFSASKLIWTSGSGGHRCP